MGFKYFSLSFIFFIFSFGPMALAQSRNAESLKEIIKLSRCVLRDYTCNMVVSGPDISRNEENAAWLLGTLAAKNAINPHGGPSPVSHNRNGDEFITLADTVGRGSKAKITLYNGFHRRKTINEKVMFLLHEIGHAAGVMLRHTQRESDDWNRVIMENCATAEIILRCSFESQFLY